MRASRARQSSAHQLASHPRARVCPALLLVSYVGQTTVPEMHKRCDMQRSIPRVFLETMATAAMVVLLLYVLFGSPV
jgi:hypothetical protein